MSGPEDLFNSVYNELFDDIYAYFNICLGESFAADLSQEVFLKVWKMIESNSAPENWRAWVFRCAVNLKNDSLRKKYTVKEIAFTEENSGNDDGLDAVHIRNAFSSLKADERELLSLKSFGFKSEEIGDMMGISASAVRTRLQKAKQSFSELLGEKENDNEQYR